MEVTMPRTKKTASLFQTVTPVSSIALDENAKNIFMRRYTVKGEDGKPKESVEEAFLRVASHVAGGEPTAKLRKEYTEHFYNLMGGLRFVPNSPTWSGSKTKLGQLAACFVLPIIDDMGKERGGIFDTLKNAALIQQTGGGNGFSFSRLRPKGDRVKASMGVASGPVSFLAAYDAAFGMIAQGGTRRGANMAVLRVDHPDIEDFIVCKAEEGRVANFNISVAITDAFMEAVEKDTDFDLINPHTNTVSRTVRARDIFNKIVHYAYRNGEPGLLFIDAANRENPVPNQYQLEATNPCGEQWLGPYENCCLGHVNINASVKNGVIDWDHLRESIELGTRFLDDVVTQNAYVPAVPELKAAAHKNRRIGLGFMGLADAMYQLGIRYGSDESIDFASQITEFVRFHSMKTSIALAKERGAFPGIKGSVYDPKHILWKIPTPLFPHKLAIKRPALSWKEIADGLKKYGIRNSTQLTVAPTGTTSTVYSVEGYGCEPVFALAYYRNVYQSAMEDKNLQLTYVSPQFQKALDTWNAPEDVKKKVIDEVIEKGSLQHIETIPEDMKHTFVVSADITPDEHVKMQAAIQRFVDNSISKTCNFPESATEDDVRKVYVDAWKLGCKGLTVYVTGSRDEVVLETNETKNKKQKGDLAVVEENVVEVATKRARPNIVIGRTHEVATPVGKAFVTVNRNGPEGTAPFEVFVNIGKSGSDSAAMAEALGRLISGWLRSSSRPNESLEEVAYQLRGIGGSVSVGFGPERITSIPDAISKVLIKELHLSEKLEASKTALLEESTVHEQQGLFHSETVDEVKKASLRNASVCPDCGNLTLVETEGCVKCQTCAYSRC